MDGSLRYRYLTVEGGHTADEYEMIKGKVFLEPRRRTCGQGTREEKNKRNWDRCSLQDRLLGAKATHKRLERENSGPMRTVITGTNAASSASVRVKMGARCLITSASPTNESVRHALSHPIVTCLGVSKEASRMVRQGHFALCQPRGRHDGCSCQSQKNPKSWAQLRVLSAHPHCSLLTCSRAVGQNRSRLPEDSRLLQLPTNRKTVKGLAVIELARFARHRLRDPRTNGAKGSRHTIGKVPSTLFLPHVFPGETAYCHCSSTIVAMHLSHIGLVGRRGVALRCATPDFG